VVLDAPQHEDNTGEYGKHQGICKMLKKENIVEEKTCEAEVKKSASLIVMPI
jgi:hypothetical protein